MHRGVWLSVSPSFGCFMFSDWLNSSSESGSFCVVGVTVSLLVQSDFGDDVLVSVLGAWMNDLS